MGNGGNNLLTVNNVVNKFAARLNGYMYVYGPRLAKKSHRICENTQNISSCASAKYHPVLHSYILIYPNDFVKARIWAFAASVWPKTHFRMVLLIK